jgi:hypothetical protein
MTSSSCSPNPFSRIHFIQRAWMVGALLPILLVSTVSLAKAAATDSLPDAPSAAQSSSPAPAQTSDQPPITIPAGTRLTLVLTHPVDSRTTPTGDNISAQITAPVILKDQVVIPAGTFVQGKVEKLTRRGTQAEMLMQSVSLVFPDGYIANAGGPVNIESDQWTAWNNPSAGSKAAIILVPFISMPLGALIGSAADGKQTSNFAGMTITTTSHKGLVIGTTIGFVGGLATSFALLARSHGFYIQEGSPLNMTLPHPVTLTHAQIDAAQSAPAPPPVPIVRPSTPPYSPGANGPVFSGPASCTAGQEWCQGRCADTISFVNDSSNCGRCGNQCSFGETCTGGFCSCGPGYSSCMGQCVNDATFISDNQNCGRCGNSCGVGQSCFGGTCTKTGP